MACSLSGTVRMVKQILFCSAPSSSPSPSTGGRRGRRGPPPPPATTPTWRPPAPSLTAPCTRTVSISSTAGQLLNRIVWKTLFFSLQPRPAPRPTTLPGTTRPRATPPGTTRPRATPPRTTRRRPTPEGTVSEKHICLGPIITISLSDMRAAQPSSRAPKAVSQENG